MPACMRGLQGGMERENGSVVVRAKGGMTGRMPTREMTTTARTREPAHAGLIFFFCSPSLHRPSPPPFGLHCPPTARGAIPLTHSPLAPNLGMSARHWPNSDTSATLPFAIFFFFFFQGVAGISKETLPVAQS